MPPAIDPAFVVYAAHITLVYYRFIRAASLAWRGQDPRYPPLINVLRRRIRQPRWITDHRAPGRQGVLHYRRTARSRGAD